MEQQYKIIQEAQKKANHEAAEAQQACDKEELVAERMPTVRHSF